MEEASEALDGTFWIFFLHFDDVDDGKRARQWKFCKFDIDFLATHTYKMFFVIHIQYDPSLKLTHTTTALHYSQHTHTNFYRHTYTIRSQTHSHDDKRDIDLLATHKIFVIHIQYDLKLTHTTTNMILTYSQHTHTKVFRHTYTIRSQTHSHDDSTSRRLATARYRTRQGNTLHPRVLVWNGSESRSTCKYCKGAKTAQGRDFAFFFFFGSVVDGQCLSLILKLCDI